MRGGNATRHLRNFVPIRNLPTQNNIKSLLISTVRCELVQKVNCAIGKFREGMLEMGSHIIAGAGKQDVLQLYADLYPTSEKVL